MSKHDHRPPLYLTELPDSFWFWETFGSNYCYFEPMWRKRAQLVRAGEQQNWRCCYCGNRCEIVATHGVNHGVKRVATREHVVPVSHGGGDEDDNIVMACARCNSDRGVSDPYNYIPSDQQNGWNVRIFAEVQSED